MKRFSPERTVENAKNAWYNNWGGVFYFDSTTSGMQHGNQLSLRLAGAYRVYLRRAIGGPLPNLLLTCSVS